MGTATCGTGASVPRPGTLDRATVFRARVTCQGLPPGCFREVDRLQGTDALGLHSDLPPRRRVWRSAQSSLHSYAQFAFAAVSGLQQTVGSTRGPVLSERGLLTGESKGEMSEWLKEHAWKLIPAALSNAYRHAPTHYLSSTSRNNDVHRSAPVNHSVWLGFQGVSDTVLTQAGF
jgi:hypothetical protein